MKVDFIGDRGGTRGLWDLGESTVVVVVFRRDPGRVAVFASAVAVVVVVFVRFFGLGSSARASAFSLSSAPKYSLLTVSFDPSLRRTVQAVLTSFSSDSFWSHQAQRHSGDCP